ncbi:MAG: hypothetical protein KBT11_01405 [Treponema sp.]|nr:hypothetical protein [Candidatus Treponema equifaecale]
MTDDELFLSTLKKIKEQMVEERSELTRTDELTNQIAAEYDEGIEILNRVLPKIKEVDDLWSIDEEDFVFVLTCFEMYSEAFIVDGTNPEKQKKDETEFSQLQDILFQFYDDEDEDYDDESEEDDYDEDESEDEDE